MFDLREITPCDLVMLIASASPKIYNTLQIALERDHVSIDQNVKTEI